MMTAFPPVHVVGIPEVNRFARSKFGECQLVLPGRMRTVFKLSAVHIDLLLVHATHPPAFEVASLQKHF
ncbi:MAG: hypothetical protein JWO50_185 [Candidatus Kaiserbacteria bacterium]|nr:hypothetical protein [Candidatus Kaiserbacteria bacterium]